MTGDGEGRWPSWALEQAQRPAASRRGICTPPTWKPPELPPHVASGFSREPRGAVAAWGRAPGRTGGVSESAVLRQARTGSPEMAVFLNHRTSAGEIRLVTCPPDGTSAASGRRDGWANVSGHHLSPRQLSRSRGPSRLGAAVGLSVTSGVESEFRPPTDPAGQ